jgi:hypothetical protein
MTNDKRLPPEAIAVLLYGPLSCLWAGLLSVYLARVGPSYVAALFPGSILQNALPFPGFPGSIQLPGLILGFSTFVLATLLGSSSRPRISVVQVRVFLVILIWLVAFPVNAVVISMSRGAELAAWMRLIFVAAHLSLAFVATFLPIRKRDRTARSWIEPRVFR